ncbi:4-hydroxybenzoate octaprenyltransferase [Zhongshania sp.]|jgi:4-hydroxybenzoate polyprenyltransferase|uniref:4-hydroxybenzoate octaprenyltransferase n=1 Tax=Zhongshania sp. TaxID=1971902 RepID=UPI001B7B32A7|nr:4-hydroxybenzoate octaprenyltransferase [Zhongshania sp.]MBQ0796468.1 4-hydroxybenzoate octaprenyltransferase [Zhongshania sp.]
MNSLLQHLKQQTPQYLALMRVDRPIGTYLVLWPTLWALWLAAGGVPAWHLLLIFVAGTFLMRSAGCVINDFADRKIDAHVSRTKARPFAQGKVTEKEALLLFAGLCLLAFALVLFTNGLTVLFSLGAVALAATYPFMKRYTHLPQLVLGAAFAWGIPMAFTAQSGELPPPAAWLLYIGVLIWTVAYDTFYAMVDREDDLKIGVKSTAILFGEDDKVITAMLQICVIIVLVMAGPRFEMSFIYYAGLIAASGLFIYQQQLIRYRQPEKCFKAFLNNNWVGAVVFAGIVLHFLIGK